MCTVIFRPGDGLSKNSLIRFKIYDVREKVSQTAVPLGSAEVTLGAIQETARLRIPLQPNAGITTAGLHHIKNVILVLSTIVNSTYRFVGY